MPDLLWLELFPPRDVSLEQLTAMVRTLASRPRLGITGRTPVVVFETWAQGGTVRWLLGIEPILTGTVPPALQAQMPGLAIAACSGRPVGGLQLAADIRITSAGNPLRVDTAAAVSTGVLHALAQVRAHETAVVQWVVGPAQNRRVRPTAFSASEALGLTSPSQPQAGEQQLWRQKTAEALFAVRGRIGVQGTSERMTIICRSLASALSAANANYAEVRVSSASQRRAKALAEAYRPGGRWSGIANGMELGLLLGWALTGVAVPGRLPITGRPPRTLLRSPDELAKAPERIVGRSLHPADHGQLVTIPQATIRQNLHLVGPTGSGKSTNLAQMILADAAAGHGILVIEPRGDLVEDVLARLPKNQHDRVVVIDPGEKDQVGVNPLAGSLDDAERRADELAGLFRAEYGSAIGARSADVLLHALLTAARLPDGTLADVPILLSNAAFRRQALAKVGDPLVLSPWWAAYESRSEAERQQIAAPIRNKLSAFLSRAPLRRMLGQGQPKFSFDDLFMREPKIVLVSLNSGVIGPEASRLLGGLLLLGAWQGLQRRARLPQAKRFPVNLVIDEFQSYVGALDFGDVLAQIRGLGGSMTAAHQHMAQLTPELRAAVAANARSRVAYRPSQDDSKPLAAIFGAPVTADDLLQLGAFQACARLLIDNTMTEPFGVQGLPLPPKTTNPDALRRHSRKRYAVDGDALDEALRKRWEGSGGSAADGRIGVKRRKSS